MPKWLKVVELKFGQLPPGRRFRWKNQLWLKTSPILASPEGGKKPALVPRSAMVEVLDEPDPAGQATGPGEAVGFVMNELRNKLLSRLEDLPLAPEQRKELAQQVALLVDQAAGRLRGTLKS